VLVMRPRQREQYLIRRQASFRALTGFFKQRTLAQERAKLLGTIVSANVLGQLS
jgi:hypothetical protein